MTRINNNNNNNFFFWCTITKYSDFLINIEDELLNDYTKNLA